MKAEQWDQVVALFERALEVSVDERDRFLEAEAASDLQLLERVAAMLRADAAARSLFGDTSGPHDEAAHGARALEGQTVGPYTIIREIGRGGMATVYLAYDIKHRRSIALKLLTADVSSALNGERFRREIGVVAQFQHPHILPLYDSGRVIDNDRARGTGQEFLYYAMPLVEGESLRQRVARDGPLPIADVRRITSDVAQALDYAHKRGVVHRDVKPANILLGEEHAFLVDFGIAHLLDDATGGATKSGALIGTPAYMSPEQASGERNLDARTDVYALGCVIFEMLTGEAPFGTAAARVMLERHRLAAPPSVRAIHPALSSDVDALVRRALAKDPAERFASARELADALDAATRSSSDGEELHGTTPRRAPWKNRRKRLLLGAVIGAALSLAGLLGWKLRQPVPTSIVVLPIENMSNELSNEDFVDGLTEELTGQLGELGKLRVTPRTTADTYKGRRYADIRRIGRELGVAWVFVASARRDGRRVRISAKLYDSKNDSLVWFKQYDRDWSSTLSLQTELAGTIVEQLALKLLPSDRTRLANRHTENIEAYEAYLRGRDYFNVRTAQSLDSARIYFRRALDIDSTYARAYAGLADTYSILAWTGSAPPQRTFVLAEQAARHALLLDSSLAEGQLSLGIIHTFHTWRWAAADSCIARAINLDSTLAWAWYFRTWPLIAAGRTEEAFASLQHARRLDPRPLITNTRIGTLLVWSHRYHEADSVLRKTLQYDRDYPVARVQLARLLSLQGHHDEAIAELPPDSVQLGSYEAGIAGFVYARAGKRSMALAGARALASRKIVPAEGVAAIYAALGDKETAMAWLEKAVAARGVGLIFLGVEPMYDGLRGNTRFTHVLEQVGVAH